MFPGVEWMVILCGYVIGCFTAGYYLVSLLAKKDIHDIGSGNVGARNAGRVLGSKGFIIVLAFDFLKGMAIVWLAYYFGLGPYWTIAAYMACVLGHIWPIQLRFRGGKGVATSVGVMTMLGPGVLVAVIVVIQFLIIFAVNRSFTISGLLSIVITPLMLLILKQPAPHVVGVALLAILLLFTHRSDIRKRLAG